MSMTSEVWREIRRGNADWESFSFPSFYLGCKRRFAQMTTDEIAAYQLEKARNIVRYAVRHAPFWAEFYRGYDLDDVWSLPSLDKRTMMAHLTEYNTLGLARDEILDFCLHVERTRDFGLRLKGINIGMSSGTSGNKGVEITTPREENYLRAAFFARFPFYSRLPIGKSAVNWGFILRVTVPAFNLKLFGNRLTYISQLDTLASIRAQLERLQPNILSGPPSILRILARERTEGRLNVAPRRLVSYAEVLEKETRAYLAEAFGCPVFEIYKATEGSIAISCAHGSLHINEDLIAVELLNEDGSPTLPGQPSRQMRVTDLHKTSQPIVRYRLNDIVTISPQRCPCGSHFRVIERIDGRADDVFWGTRVDTASEDGGWQFIFPDYIARAIIAVADEIDEYQVVQRAPDDLLVRLQLAGGDAERIVEDVESALCRVFMRYGCHPPAIEVRLEPPVPNPNSGKLIRVQCAFQP
ncbi:MAG: AMP-binding protein [Anaerolineae bacterium]|nr:AMP-binding protein [Anaerolineae bacterium]